MKFARTILVTTALSAALTLSSCSSLPSFGRGAAEAREAEDKAGRLAMVLDEEKVAPEPGLAGVPIELPAAVAVDAWPEAGGGPSKSTGHLQAAPDLQIDWRRSAGKGSTRKAALTATPVTDGEHIYVLDSQQTVRAMRLSDGANVWSEKLKGLSKRDKSAVGGGIAVSGDTLIVASGYGYVVAMDSASGEEKWKRALGAPMTGSPTVADGRVFISSNNNEIFALDLATGQTQWSDQAISETARVLGSSSVAAVEEFVIAPFSSGEIIAYLASNGRRLWTDAIQQAGGFTPISEINDIGSRPILGAGMVFASNQSGATVAIDGRTGNRIWNKPIGSTRAPALAGRYLFVMGLTGELACLDAQNGDAFWVTSLPQFKNEEKKKNRISYTSPIIASDRVITVSSEGELLAFSTQTGQQTASLKLGDTVYLEPIAAQGKLYVLTDEARLIAIR
ncbi:PQQ enzyme repeat domain protein [Hyphomonas neptunium ATCC 15444]|uniref:PQQ enzyme repeat domain protein n=2 Tax=Hyphomonas TaxID=85 RepID=Q0C442_HYPNA|nr:MULTISPECIES: PQQ-binding-like beta-propeller repeat protein [Hyphomonas]ABI76395.1 PQQ enzyme repeat domain protein [Hyphomonas neptunium ATCC 15444]KCZ96287.1 PQQ repeat-containing protein [Hyphomonas hirschiana VP5]